jgi:hypothetical protein
MDSLYDGGAVLLPLCAIGAEVRWADLIAVAMWEGLEPILSAEATNSSSIEVSISGLFTSPKHMLFLEGLARMRVRHL